MGNDISKCKINFEDMQNITNNSSDYIIINTLNENMQQCLIINTLRVSDEEEIINELLHNNNKDKKIVIYGKNNEDEKIYEKLSQLAKLGFTSIYIYSGGMFEWLLLQDIYGNDMFPTTCTELDILKYKPFPKINVKYLTYN